MSNKKTLVIVESPAKAKTIEKYLGSGFQVTASMGHVRDLPEYKLGINIENNFEPAYQALKTKAKFIKEVNALAKKVDTVMIATDPDREGEAIAWHIQESLSVPADKVTRVVFNEITKDAVQSAIQNTRPIDMHLVDAQQARRILDRLIGYKLSPILGKKIRKGLSAGRVQSVTLKIICIREAEIIAFVPEEYWLIDAQLNGESGPVKARVFSVGESAKTSKITSEADANKIMAALKTATYEVNGIKTATQHRNPYPPFITSTLQQEAAKRFNWTTKRTMMIAQQLYEGVQIKGEPVGLITYMRTDSVRLSDEAKTAAHDYIKTTYGDRYLSTHPATKKKTGKVQDAHEAIRPTSLAYTPDKLATDLTPEQVKLYKLIFNRFLASQMAQAEIESTTVTIQAQTNELPIWLKLTGSRTLFDGFTKLYEDTQEESIESDQLVSGIPILKEGQKLTVEDLSSAQKFTRPPSRYTEASLVKELEEKGIGRPSTYAPTISTILDRDYIIKEGRQLVPTELGTIVYEQLHKYFDSIIDINFTAGMETQLDEIMDGHHVWQEIVGKFYLPFTEMLAYASENMEKINTDKPTDEVCDKCAHPMVIKSGRFGEFLACSNFPECKNTKAIKKELNVTCPKCGGNIVEKMTRKKKVFYGCDKYPACDFASWDRPIQQACSSCKHPILVEKGRKGTLVCPSCNHEN